MYDRPVALKLKKHIRRGIADKQLYRLRFKMPVYFGVLALLYRAAVEYLGKLSVLKQTRAGMYVYPLIVKLRVFFYNVRHAVRDIYDKFPLVFLKKHFRDKSGYILYPRAVRVKLAYSLILFDIKVYDLPAVNHEHNGAHKRNSADEKISGHEPDPEKERAGIVYTDKSRINQ